jgi:hypothetical protein
VTHRFVLGMFVGALSMLVAMILGLLISGQLG